ncbi:PepSY-associated TM helix domain-containing protein [Neisseria musculi]|uniref:PepSY-associated TM helix domain-containing protein n=1 Tax=Neisseria musculi TaxID=1815583 RepID=UPI00164C80C4|nr:PepSY domain-containing protein [Neisseria musculi]QNT60068.1 pepSY-associated TM helix family protein [Neisseria musculi]
MQPVGRSCGDQSDAQRYFTVWRWHFYAGVFVTPFLILLALTGLGMIFTANIYGKDGERMKVAVQTVAKPLSQQAQVALDAVDKAQGMVVQYIAPRAADTVAVFRVNDGSGKATMVAVDPYTAEVAAAYPRNKGFYYLMDNIHSDMLLGGVGDYILETAAALTVLLVISGWWLWYQKQGSLPRMLVSPFGKKRSWWRSLHGSVGTWISLMLLVFCVSGMAWAGIWGGKAVQAWNQFPAGKWGVVPDPESVVPVHGDLNDGETKEIPWVLELTPMPQSGTTVGVGGIAPGLPPTLDTVDRFARESGFQGRYHLYFPKGKTGVWTLNRDSMSYDSPSPTADRTVHIDRYSGKVLADIRFNDYSAFGKFMAAGVAFHMGTMGWWSVVLNMVFCLAVVGMCVSGWIMWWQRRPKNAAGLLPPPQKNVAAPKTLLVVLLVSAVVFPTAAAAVAAVWLLDRLLLVCLPRMAAYLK